MGSNQRPLSLALSLFLSFFLAFQIIQALSVLKTTVQPELHLIRISLALAFFYLPILGGWIAFRLFGGLLFALFASVMVFFAGSVSASPIFIWFLLEYSLLCYLLFRLDLDFENRVALVAVDSEQYQNEKNDLEVSYKVKGEGISILFEKYSTYYNLRKLAEELATVLNVGRLASIVVDRAHNFIPRGNLVIATLAQTDGTQLAAVAFSHFPKTDDKWILPNHYARGDMFDFWVIKNRRRLIVSNTLQDFRFDVREAAKFDDLRSLIIAPLFHEGRVIGTLRINSPKPDIFTNDDLRLLDTIAVLGSSALSNAILYEQTEELAIRDSLTGLFVRRYFFDRFKEEHRRALLTHRPLSLIMCDLDHFKSCNDRYGHSAGDLMLTQFAKILSQITDHAIVSRYGGEEFALLLPETSKADAVKIANIIREKVERTPFIVRRENITMTISIGVSNLPDDALDLEDMIHKADQALYQAKRSGRNRVCSSGS